MLLSFRGDQRGEGEADGFIAQELQAER